MLASTGLAEEGVETVVTPSNCLVRWHLAVGLNAMFKAIQFPAGITNLDSSLANVDRDTLTLQTQKEKSLRDTCAGWRTLTPAGDVKIFF